MQNWTTCNLDACLLKEHCHGILWPSAACPPISSLWHMTHAKANACYSRGLSCDVMLLCLLLNCACSCRMAHVRRQKQANKNGHGRNGSLVQTEKIISERTTTVENVTLVRKKKSPPLGHRALLYKSTQTLSTQTILFGQLLHNGAHYYKPTHIVSHRCICFAPVVLADWNPEGTGRTIYNNLYTETILHIIKSQHKWGVAAG